MRGFGRARLITTTISSPINERGQQARTAQQGREACVPILAMPCPVLVLRTFTHSATNAPELSMMF